MERFVDDVNENDSGDVMVRSLNNYVVENESRSDDKNKPGGDEGRVDVMLRKLSIEMMLLRMTLKMLRWGVLIMMLLRKSL